MTLMEKPTGRRGFLKGAAIAGADLLIGFRFDPRGFAGQAFAAEGASRGEFAANAFIRIAPDNSVTILCKHIEFGQGPFTGFATIIADELDAHRDQIKVEHAPADVTKYANLQWGAQGTAALPQWPIPGCNSGRPGRKPAPGSSRRRRNSGLCQRVKSPSTMAS